MDEENENTEIVSFPIPIWLFFIGGLCYIFMLVSGYEITIWTGVATVLLLIFGPMWSAFFLYWLPSKRKKWGKLEEEHAKEIGETLKDEFVTGIYLVKESLDIHFKKEKNGFQNLDKLLSDEFILTLKHLEEYPYLSKKLGEIEGLFNKTKSNLSKFKKCIQDKIIVEYSEECKDDLFKVIRKIINKMWKQESIEKIDTNQLIVYPDLLVYFNGEQIAQLDKNKFDKEKVKEFFLIVLNNDDFQNELKQIKINYNKIDDDLKEIIEEINRHSSDIIKGKEELKIIENKWRWRKKICDDCPTLFWFWNGRIF